MSRYRVSYLNSSGQEQVVLQVNPTIDMGITILISLPEAVMARLRSLTSAQAVAEVSDSIRLIADETAGGIVLCSTGKKNRIRDVGVSESHPFITLSLDYPEGAVKYDSGGSGSTCWLEYTITKYGITKHYTVRSSDSLTIEFDWGDETSSISGEVMIIMTEAEKQPALDDLDDLLDALDDEEGSGSGSGNSSDENNEES